MADSKQQIELEVQQVQEHLTRLTADRCSLQQEFEQLTKNSSHLLQQIKEDTTLASEKKLHNYEAEKKRIEEKLEALEKDILEKNRKIALLDAKIGDYLLQVSTTDNSLFDGDNEKVEKSGVDSGDSASACPSAVTVGEGKVSVEGARVDSSKEGEEEKCCEKSNGESNQVNAENSQIITMQEKTIKDSGEVSNVISSKASDREEEVEEELGARLTREEPLQDGGDKGVDGAGTVELPDSKNDKDTGKGETENASEGPKNIGKLVNNATEVKCEEKELAQTDNMPVKVEGKVVENKFTDLKSDKNAVDNVASVENIVPAENSDMTNIAKIDDKEESMKKDLNVVEVIPSAVTQPEDTSKVEKESSQLAAAPSAAADSAADSGPLLTASTEGGMSGINNAGKQTNGSGSPVRDQMTSLSMLVAELRRVKDDMGKCMSVKEQSFIELEDQLQAANKEVAALKLSVSLISKDLEEKKQSYQALEEENKKKKMDIELKMTEIQDVTNKCTMLAGEKTDLLRKMEVLEMMMTEYRTELEMLINEKTKVEQQTKELLAAKATTSVAEAEIGCTTSVEEKEREIAELVEKTQSMETEMKDLNDKLKVTNRHLKIMAREREHKQKECEILKRKVEMVELKMCELQGTFDRLVKAVMIERDDLIKEMEEKNIQVDDFQQTLVRLKDTHEQELENVLYEKKLLDDELSKYKSGELRPTTIALVEKAELDNVTQQKDMLESQVKQKNEEIESLEKKVKTIQDDMNDFVGSLKDEMARMKDEGEKMKEENTNLTETFTALQTEHLDITDKHKCLLKSFQEIEKSNKEKTSNLEALKLQLEDLQQQLENLNTKNFSLTTDMYKKEEEFREELAAREGTIQELTVTLTNNQKQSMENYNALQEDMSTLETKLKNSVEENKKNLKEMEEKLTHAEEDKNTQIKILEEKLKSAMADLKERESRSVGAVSTLPLEASVESLPATHSLRLEAECRVVVDKDRQTELLPAQDQAEGSSKPEFSAAEKDAQNVDVDTYKMQQTIKELTAELETLKGKSLAGKAFKNHEEFEAVIASKEKKIGELEMKVSDLEMCLANKSGYITLLEGKLKDASDVQNNVESHLEQINKLSTDITKLKDELEQTHGECATLKNTVSQLEKDKMSVEDEKTKLKEEYESKLQQANGSAEDARAELEQKKNSVEKLKLKLSSSRSSHVEEVAQLESDHVVRVGELVRFHKQKLEELKASNAAKVSELLKHIDDTTEEKAALEDELEKLKIEHNETISSREESLMQERDCLQKKVQDLEQFTELLEKEKLQIEEEKQKLKIGFEEEQIMAIDMQTQMVSDLEKLILNLESEKGSLEKQIVQLKASCEEHSGTILDGEKKVAILEDQIIVMAKEKEVFKEEIKKLKEIIGEETVSRISEDHKRYKTIEELTAKVQKLEDSLENANVSIEEQEQIYSDKLNEEKDDHLMQLKALRKELSEEIGVIEERKQQVALEYEDKIALIVAEYQEQLSTTTNKYEARLLEEKAEFGRVLVAKIDEYEGKLASQAAEITSYETQLDALQTEVEEKVKVIEELEFNLDELTLMRAALRAQVDDLKLTITKINEGKEETYLDVLHSEYESRLAEVQEHYETQLNFLRSLVSRTEFEVPQAGCSSPSQGSEYSIELSCLRPYLQGQSSPISDFMTELRSQSAQGCATGLGDDQEAQAINYSCHMLARSASGAKSKDRSRSHSSADSKMDMALTSLSAHLQTRAISKAKSKCKSNGSIPRVVLNLASRSELRLLQSSLGSKSEPQTTGSKSNIVQKPKTEPQCLSEAPAGVTDDHQPSNTDAVSSEHPENKSDCDPESIGHALDSLPAATTGTIPRPPRRVPMKAKSSPAADVTAVEMAPAADVTAVETAPAADVTAVETAPAADVTAVETELQPSTVTATSSTTHLSDPDPNNTALDKYRMTEKLSACCVVL